MESLTPKESEEIALILGRRANEIASYSGDNRDKMPGSVEQALSREIKRLRDLADKLTPEKPDSAS